VKEEVLKGRDGRQKGNLNKIYETLNNVFRSNFESIDPASWTDFQAATYAMLTRTKSLLTAIQLLISKSFIAESAILARSLVELNWKYLFLINAKMFNEDGVQRFQFDDSPPKDSLAFKRAMRFLSWHWAEAYRGGNRDEKVVRMYEKFKNTFGYKHDGEVPREWYFEKANKISHIKDIAIYVGGKEQYNEDYRHLSGIEHTDITSVIVERIGSEKESLYVDFVFFKALQIFECILEITMNIFGKNVDDVMLNSVRDLNSLSDDLNTHIWGNKTKRLKA
jgi:hypothetical protein